MCVNAQPHLKFALGSCCCEPTSCCQELSMQAKQVIIKLQNQNKIHQRYRRNIRSGQTNSLW